jgi:DNA invertase Pin-like site-specific DNA recombinase
VFHIFAALAEFERDLIRKRTHAGLAAARTGGRPSVMTPDKVAVARELYESSRYTVAAIAKTLGVRRASIYRHLPAAVAAQAAGAEETKERLR